jgi:hypothetical protein
MVYSLKARTVESEQWLVNNRRMEFSVQSVPMAVYATMEYVILSLSRNCIVTEKRCFLRGPRTS